MSKVAMVRETVLILLGWPLLAVLSVAGIWRALLASSIFARSHQFPMGGWNGLSGMALMRSILLDPVIGGIAAAAAVLSATLLLACREALGDFEESCQAVLIASACYSVASFIAGGI